MLGDLINDELETNTPKKYPQLHTRPSNNTTLTQCRRLCIPDLDQERPTFCVGFSEPSNPPIRVVGVHHCFIALTRYFPPGDTGVYIPRTHRFLYQFFPVREIETLSLHVGPE